MLILHGLFGIDGLPKTRVIVSYYEHPDLAALYPDWTKREVHRSKALVSSGKRDKGNDIKAPELLIINGPSYSGGAS
jgi:hypothetical protein